MCSAYEMLEKRYGSAGEIAEQVTRLALNLGLRPVRTATVHVWKARGVPRWVIAATGIANLVCHDALGKSDETGAERDNDKHDGTCLSIEDKDKVTGGSSTTALEYTGLQQSGPYLTAAHDEHASSLLQYVPAAESFRDIEPPTLQQEVFEVGLREALDQATHEARLAALDTLQAQIARKVA